MDDSWIWSALALGKLDLIKDADLGQFDWNAQHAHYGTPLIAIVMGKSLPVASGGSSTETSMRVSDFISSTAREKESRLELMKIALASGGNPNVRAPPDCPVARRWWKLQEVEKTKTCVVDVKNSSVLSVVMKIIEALQVAEGDWKEDLAYLASAMRLLSARASSPPLQQKIAISEAVVDTWEAVLNDVESADVTIACAEGGEIRAHAVVLRCASKVLRAMFSSSFREGTTKRIEVTADAHSVRLLLELVYTGTSGPLSDEGGSRAESTDVGAEDCGPDGQGLQSTRLMVSTLDLAHQFQIDHVVQMLTKELANQLTEHSFGPACELGLRLQLPTLLRACRELANSSPAIRKDFDAGAWPEPVQIMLREGFGLAPPQKRRRQGL